MLPSFAVSRAETAIYCKHEPTYVDTSQAQTGVVVIDYCLVTSLIFME